MKNELNLHPEPSSSIGSSEKTIALLPYGETWEAWHDKAGISFEAFCNELTGGWLFGYIDALRLANVNTILFYVSTRVSEPSYFTHTLTGAKICLLPAPKLYLLLRSQIGKPGLFFKVLSKLLRLVVPYLSTPITLLAKELRREKCRAILCQEYEYFRFDICILLGQLMRLSVFASFQGGNFDRNRIGRWLHLLTMQFCGGLIIGTQLEIQRVRERYNLQPAKIAQIFNPVDLRMWGTLDRNEAKAEFGIPHNALVVVWHGRISINVKGLDILLDAFEKICSEQTDADIRLLLMGTGSDSEELRQRISELPSQKVIWLDAFVNDRQLMHRFLSAGDVYAFPSRHEGFPVAPIEAMACGLPVVASEAPGVPDIFINGVDSGGLVVPCNDTAAFANALGQLLDDEALRRKLGKCAQHRVEEYFGLERVGEQLYNFLFKVK